MRSALLAASVLLCLAACDDEIQLPTQEVATGELSMDYCGAEAIMAARCTSCHSEAGGSDPYLTNIAEVVDLESGGYAGEFYVVPGDADASFLYAKVAGTQGDMGGQMPLGGTLSDEELEVLSTWINDGATTDCEAR